MAARKPKPYFNPLRAKLAPVQRTDPEMKALVARASDPCADEAARTEARHAIADLAERRNAETADAPASVSLTAGLTLYPIPSGLSPEEELEAARHMLWLWVEGLAGSFRVRGDARRRALRAAARDWGEQPTQAKQRLLQAGLISAARRVNESARVRLGSGPGSGWVEGRPADLPLLLFLLRLGQEAKAEASSLLDAWTPDPEPEGSEGDVDPDELPGTGPDALDELISREEVELWARRLLECCRGQQAAKVERLLQYEYGAGDEHRTALEMVAAQFEMTVASAEELWRRVCRSLDSKCEEDPRSD